MDLKKLELPGLELVDPNTEYSCNEQIFYIDFDGVENVSYNNDALDIHIDNITVSSSGLSEEEQFQIITELNNTFAGTGIYFTANVTANMKYSTIYVGDAGNAFAEYGHCMGVAETVDTGNLIHDDNAFVFSNILDSTIEITEIISHEAGHLLGYRHVGEVSAEQDITDFCATASIDILGPGESSYSGNYHISDDDLYTFTFIAEAGDVFGIKVESESGLFGIDVDLAVCGLEQACLLSHTRNPLLDICLIRFSAVLGG